MQPVRESCARFRTVCSSETRRLYATDRQPRELSTCVQRYIRVERVVVVVLRVVDAFAVVSIVAWEKSAPSTVSRRVLSCHYFKPREVFRISIEHSFSFWLTWFLRSFLLRFFFQIVPFPCYLLLLFIVTYPVVRFSDTCWRRTIYLLFNWTIFFLEVCRR